MEDLVGNNTENISLHYQEALPFLENGIFVGVFCMARRNLECYWCDNARDSTGLNCHLLIQAHLAVSYLSQEGQARQRGVSHKAEVG
jgi:hypothetical protein